MVLICAEMNLPSLAYFKIDSTYENISFSSAYHCISHYEFQILFMFCFSVHN